MLDHKFVVTYQNKLTHTTFKHNLPNLKSAIKKYDSHMFACAYLKIDAIVDLIDGESGEILMSSEDGNE